MPTSLRPRPGARHHRARASVVVLLALVASSCAYRVRLTPSTPQAGSTFIYAADGSIITRLHAEEDRVPVKLAKISKDLQDAVVAIEDERFYHHNGVDLRATLRALLKNARSGEVIQGGSTITQQYVKNVLLRSERTVGRKIKEASLAFQLEKKLSKQAILERYLNTVYFGNGAYGAEAAARRFFGKHANELTLPEAALLAGAIRAPERYNPFQDPAASSARREVVLRKMRSLGMIDDTRLQQALGTPIEVKKLDETYPAGHFVEAVKRFVFNDPTFGATPEQRRDLLFRGGLRIYTTIDMRLQQRAESAVRDVLNRPGDPVAAVVALDPRTGEVRALYGGGDFFSNDPKAKFDFATVGRRQAGSAFKPFALTDALLQGISPNSVFPAPPTIEINLGRGQPPWRVSNFDRESFGPLNLYAATAHSVNTVYAQLVMKVGAKNVTDLATRMGITAPLEPFPSAVLGTNSVSPLDMASAYGTLDNDGNHVAPAFVTKVTDERGKLLWQHEVKPERIVPVEVARNVTRILQGVITGGTGVRARIGRPAAGKTGTNEEFKDAWFVGYTPELVTAVWVGFPDRPRPMVPPATRIRVQGGSWPAQIWQLFMSSALAETPASDFPEVPPLKNARIIRICGGDTPPPGDQAGAGPTSNTVCPVATTTSSTDTSTTAAPSTAPPTTAPPSTAPPTTAPPTTAPPTTAPPTTAPPTTAPPTTAAPTTTASTPPSPTTTTKT